MTQVQRFDVSLLETPARTRPQSMDTILLKSAKASLTRNYLRYRATRELGEVDTDSVLATLEAAGTFVLAGGRMPPSDEAQFLRDIREAVVGLPHEMLGEDAFAATRGTPDGRDESFELRDRIALTLVGAVALAGQIVSCCPLDDLLSSLDAFDAIVGPELTQAERDKHAWIAPSQRAHDWRAPLAEVIPLREKP